MIKMSFFCSHYTPFGALDCRIPTMEVGAIPTESIMNEKNAEYAKIAKKLINTLPELEYIRDAEVKIAFLSSDVEKKKDGRIVYADCTKVNKARYDWCCKYDFFITVYEPNILEFNEEQVEALLQHELLHIGIKEDGEEPSFYVVPHDIEEFWAVINRHGMDWQKKEDK